MAEKIPAIRIQAVTAVGTKAAEPYVEVELHSNQKLNVVFSPDMARPLISAFAASANNFLAREAVLEKGRVAIPVALDCSQIAAFGNKTKPDSFGILLTLIEGPDIAFSLPRSALSPLITALEAVRKSLPKESS